MKKTLFTLFAWLFVSFAMADSVFYDSFEYANHDGGIPIGWNCNDSSWVCGYLEKDHNRIAHHGNWYVHTNADDSWMFMQNYMSTQLKYRFSYWAISDGSYDVEVWAGSAPDTEHMTEMLYSSHVSTGNYEKFSAYLETLASDYQYFGIHAIAGNDAYYLTIDEFSIDMVNKYDLEVTPYILDTVMFPGTSFTFNYQVQNTGYEDLFIYMTPINAENFHDITFTEDGLPNSSFPTVANQIVNASCSATLNSDLTEGSVVWLDIMFTVSCDCVTRMATVWVTVGDPTEVQEQDSKVSIFPNPTANTLNVKAEGLMSVEVTDITGKKAITALADNNDLQIDLEDLPSGIYFVTVTTASERCTEKVIKR